MTFENQKQIVTEALDRANTPKEWIEQLMEVAFEKGEEYSGLLIDEIQNKIAERLSEYLYPEEQEWLENLSVFIGEHTGVSE